MTSASAFPEVYLARLWSSGYLFGKTLSTDAGDPVEIHHPGSENRSNGPDFLDATLLIGNRPVTGHVEFHVQSEDWFTHHHPADPAYQSCILHVSWYNLPGYTSVPAGTRKQIPHLTLSRFLTFQDLLSLLTVEDKLNFTRKTPCESRIRLVSAAAIRAWTAELGHQSLIGKVNRYANRLKQLTANPVYLKGKRYVWDQMLFEGLFRALGYPSNTTRFERLSRELPVTDWPDLTEGSGEVLHAEWLFLAGLDRDPEFEPGFPDLIRPEILRRGPVFHAGDWKTKSVRAANQPEKRLKAAAELTGRFYHTGFLKPLILTLDACMNMALRPEKIVPELMALLTPSGDGEVRIGKERREAILFNTWLPVLYLYAREFRRTDLQDLILTLCDVWPHRQEIALDQSLRQIFGLQERTYTLHWGLLNLHQNWCLQKKCLDCRIGQEIRKEL